VDDERRAKSNASRAAEARHKKHDDDVDAADNAADGSSESVVSPNSKTLHHVLMLDEVAWFAFTLVSIVFYFF
jgi:hypothetical protein